MVWLQRVDVKQFLSPVDVSDAEANAIGKRICAYLKQNLPNYQDSDEFRVAACQEDVNQALADLYDWADIHRVWLGLKGAP